MNAKFYRFIVKGNDKKGGVLYSPKSWPYPIAVDGQEVKNWESLVVELKDGIYRPFQLCVGGANMVNQDLKDLLQSFIGYGEHFKKIFDVIDTKNTLYVEGTDSVIKLKLDYNKVKDLKVFNSQPAINDIIVSDEVRKSIRKNKLDLGLEFMPVYCGGE